MKKALVILNKLTDLGFEAYIVGGFPRDKYLNRETNDIDICTNALPSDIESIFDVDIKNSKYGNTKVKNIEITTFRKELDYSDNRHPNKIIFLKNLKDDLIRRDFIINTLCLDKNNEYIDLLGAREDLDKKIIKMVGNADKRLKEDSLRILRALRFSVTLNFEIDDDLNKAIINNSYLLNKLSYQRKKEELDKIFMMGEKGKEILLKYQMDKYLELSKLKECDMNKNIWKQLNVFDIYPFTKQEKNDIMNRR